MAEIKSHEFDQFLAQRARSYRIFVIYGPDRGLVSERADAIAGRSGVSLDDPFSVIKLEVEAVKGNAGRLLDEVNAIGLFGGERLIWLRGAANERPLIDAVTVLADQTLVDTHLIIEAGDLKKGTGLRKIADGSRSIASIACYPDDGRALNALIDSELAQENLRITPDARQMLVDLIGGDRIASRNELRKLALYCRGLTVIDAENVTDIIGDASAVSVDDAVDAIFSGDRERFVHETRKIISSKVPIFLILQACLRQLQFLDILRTEMDEKAVSPAQLMQTHGRHLHFRKKPVVEQALKTWGNLAIAREMRRLQAAILQSRQRQGLEESIALQTLLAITLQSARRP